MIGKAASEKYIYDQRITFLKFNQLYSSFYTSDREFRSKGAPIIASIEWPQQSKP